MCVILLLKPLSLDNFIKKYSQLFFTQLSISICIILVEVVDDEILYELLWFPSLFMNLLYALQFHSPGLFSSFCLFPLFLFSILAYSHKISQYSRIYYNILGLRSYFDFKAFRSSHFKRINIHSFHPQLSSFFWLILVILSWRNTHTSLRKIIFFIFA